VQGLRGGWRSRLDDVVARIHQNSIARKPARVTGLIREESIDEVSVIVARADDLPGAPGEREAVTISRWQLLPLVEAGGEAGQPTRAWTWSFGDPDRGELSHWEELRDEAQMLRAFVVCISPTAARYTEEVGLEIGEAGDHVSQKRELPPKPGYKPLHRETWAHHARAVADAAERRVVEDDGVPGFLGDGLATRYGLITAEVLSAARTSGLFHDLGKLQRPWQEWAEAWQATKEPGYVHTEGLAHTNFDPESRADRMANRTFRPQRPTHAAASALVAWPLLQQELQVRTEFQGLLASAVLASVLSHHGGWLPQDLRRAVAPLWSRWRSDLASAQIAPPDRTVIQEAYDGANRNLGTFLERTTTRDALEECWPLFAYLMRTLRLADQRATAEGSEGVC
jgi:CRISPR-associated endonuclease Cas3-HD